MNSLVPFRSKRASDGPEARAEQEAADWLARQNGRLTRRERTAFVRWLAADPQHEAAYARLHRTWDFLGAPAAAGLDAELAGEIAAVRAARRRRRAASIWLALATAAAVAFTIARPPATRDAPGLVERRPAIQTLPDGSKVVVRPGSEIAVAFSAQQRAITLTRGEALFTVAPDPGRPFVVQAGTAQVRAVGTEFAVRRETRGVDVLVTHGRIAVTMESERTAPVEPPVFAEAGHRVVADHAAPRPRVEPVDSATLARALRWRGARIEFSGTPLVEALATFNRESGYALHLADPALGQRAITGVLWTDDADGFVRLLEQGFDLVAERDGERLRLRAK